MTWDDLPRSPSGRVPQWLLDEAAGRTGPHPAGPPPEPHPRRPRLSPLPWLAIAAVLGLAWVLSERADDLAAAADAQGPQDHGSGAVASGPYAYLGEDTDASGRPYVVTWSTCEPIRYVVNLDGAPDGFEVTVREVLDEVTAASGLVFTYDGPTTETAAERTATFARPSVVARTGAVLFAVADEESAPDLAGDVAGYAQSVTSVPGRDGRVRYTSGLVVLDRDVTTVRGPSWREPVYVPVLRHEVGHLVGLDHVDDRAQIMYPETNDVDVFQPGDLVGLAELGRGGCTSG